MLRKSNPANAPAGSPSKVARCSRRFGFTMIEMLTVIVIISIIAGVSLPAVRGLSHSHGMTSASQQLEDDFALARHMAINNRTTVYVMFVPTNLYSINLPGSPTLSDASALRQLWGKTYTSYALYVDRMAGDQPGQGTPRYLTEWKTLPDGVYIDRSAYHNYPVTGRIPHQDLPLLYKTSSAFPLSTSTPINWAFPCVAFDYTGELFDASTGLPALADQVIPLDRGAVFYSRNAAGNLVNLPPDLPIPPANASTDFCRIRINHLTGRSRIEKPVLP